MAKSQISIRFGNLVREYRQKAGLSQEELASQCDLHRTYVGSIERGEKAISVEAALKLCDGLGITASEFFTLLEKRLD